MYIFHKARLPLHYQSPLVYEYSPRCCSTKQPAAEHHDTPVVKNLVLNFRCGGLGWPGLVAGYWSSSSKYEADPRDETKVLHHHRGSSSARLN